MRFALVPEYDRNGPRNPERLRPGLWHGQRRRCGSRRACHWVRASNPDAARPADDPAVIAAWNGASLELLIQAAEFIGSRSSMASPGMLSRGLGISYQHAGEVLDLLHAEGIVGPPRSGCRSREVGLELLWLRRAANRPLTVGGCARALSGPGSHRGGLAAACPPRRGRSGGQARRPGLGRGG